MTLKLLLLSEKEEEAEDPLIWATVATVMRVGFLLVIPKPITERATVRHCLTSFQSIR